MRHHRDHDETPAPLDPVAVAVWTRGLTQAPASAPLVIKAPHAAELVPADRDAA